MKVLITGVAGFFGSNLAEHFLEKGYEVVGIDNFNEYYSPALKEYNIRDFKDHENFKLYRTDILDNSALEEIFTKEGPFHTIVHLAAWAGVTYSIDHPNTYVRNNVEGTVNMAQLALKYPVKCFIFASTSSVYGENPTPFSEDMPLSSAKAPYPVTKIAGELILKTFSENFGLPVTVIRIFNPQGKRVRPDLAISKPRRERADHLPRDRVRQDRRAPVYQDLHDTGRDYCYIGHMFEAIDKIMENPFSYEVFNLGNSSPVTLGELISAVEKATGKKVNAKQMPERKGEMQLTFANIDKAKKMLGYNPTTSIEECVRMTYEWYLQQDEDYKLGRL